MGREIDPDQALRSQLACSCACFTTKFFAILDCMRGVGHPIGSYSLQNKHTICGCKYMRLHI